MCHFSTDVSPLACTFSPSQSPALPTRPAAAYHSFRHICGWRLSRTAALFPLFPFSPLLPRSSHKPQLQLSAAKDRLTTAETAATGLQQQLDALGVELAELRHRAAAADAAQADAAQLRRELQAAESQVGGLERLCACCVHVCVC